MLQPSRHSPGYTKTQKVTKEGSLEQQTAAARQILNESKYHVTDRFLVQPDLIFEANHKNILDPLRWNKQDTYPLTESLMIFLVGAGTYGHQLLQRGVVRR